MGVVMAFVVWVLTEVRSVLLAMMVACVLPWLLSFLAKHKANFKIFKDNQHPRQFDFGQGVASRLYAAHKNHYETLPVFLASVIVAMYFFVPQTTVNMYAWLYVVLRVLYAVAYAINWHIWRSVLWLMAWLSCLSLFYFAIQMASL